MILTSCPDCDGLLHRSTADVSIPNARLDGGAWTRADVPCVECACGFIAELVPTPGYLVDVETRREKFVVKGLS